MVTRLLLIAILWPLLFSCEGNGGIQCTDGQKIDVAIIDSITFTRLAKANWIEREYIPKEEISITLRNGRTFLRRDSLTLVVNDLTEVELDSLEFLLHQVAKAHIDRIFNSEQVWLPDIELYVYCTPIEESFMIKSFGNSDEVPTSLQFLNSFLLRKMKNNFSNF